MCDKSEQLKEHFCEIEFEIKEDGKTLYCICSTQIELAEYQCPHCKKIDEIMLK